MCRVCVCVCGLWSSRASHLVQMWCNKTSAHIWKGTENMRVVPPEQVAHGNIIPGVCMLLWTFSCFFFSCVCWCKVEESLISRWSSPLAHVGMELQVLAKIRLVFRYLISSGYRPRYLLSLSSSPPPSAHSRSSVLSPSTGPSQ